MQGYALAEGRVKKEIDTQSGRLEIEIVRRQGRSVDADHECELFRFLEQEIYDREFDMPKPGLRWPR